MGFAFRIHPELGVDIPSELLSDEAAQYAEERRARSHRAILKRNVIFEYHAYFWLQSKAS